MAVAIVLGALAGVVGFLLLVVGLRLAKNATPTSNLSHMGALLLGVLGSFVVLAGAAFACILAARDAAVPFVLAEAISLSVAAIGYGIVKMVGRK